MAALLHKGENVRHNKRAEWGVGKIIEIDSCGTIKVVFEGDKEVSIAKGANYLTKDKEGDCGDKKTAPRNKA
jgi:Protein of unknown function (DUF3553)